MNIVHIKYNFKLFARFIHNNLTQQQLYLIRRTWMQISCWNPWTEAAIIPFLFVCVGPAARRTKYWRVSVCVLCLAAVRGNVASKTYVRFANANEPSEERGKSNVECWWRFLESVWFRFSRFQTELRSHSSTQDSTQSDDTLLWDKYATSTDDWTEWHSLRFEFLLFTFYHNQSKHCASIAYNQDAGQITQ